MCGIAGIVSVDAGRLDVRPALDAMQAALRHRGPDGMGQWHSSSGVASFAHTRLAVIDLSPAGHQPMSTPDGRFTIVFNGEIYNFRELRRSLELEGVQFMTHSDTEVILRAYEARGEACIKQLRGMFALAIWDERERECLLARDRFGIKPLYYQAAHERLLFGSEVRALLGSGLVARDLDAQAVYGYFRSGSVPEPRTLLRTVKCLEAGQVGCWRDGRLDSRRYWDLRFGTAPISTGEAAASARATLLDSVDHHFIGDVPVGILLSGGIDSTALVALAHATGRTGVRTITMSLPGSQDDEGASARRVARHFGTSHENYPVDAVVGRSLFEQFVCAADQPSVDGLNTFAVSGFARARGLKVVLSGLGADELFGGYPSFRTVPRMARWDQLLDQAGPFRRALGRTIEGLSPSARSRRLGDMLAQSPGLLSAYTTFRGIFSRGEARALTRHYAGETDGELGDDATGKEAPAPSAADEVSRLELTRYVRNQLLRDSDVMSLAWGLELRTPFLDAGVVDAVAQVPAPVRLAAGKRLLVEAVPEVPEWVRCQPKRCFQFPFGQWLDGEWRDVFAEVDRTSPVPTGTWYRKWSVFMFERWMTRHG